MALRQALNLPLGARLFSSGFGRSLGAAANEIQQGAVGLSTSASGNTERETKGSEVQQFAQQAKARSMLNTWSMQGMPALASREEQQQPSLTAPAASMLASAMRGKMGAMPMLPGRRAGIMTSGIKPLQAAQQRRAYNAWSPAQRYFVEGQHVIDAEANRTLQFTGLDSGSFYPFLVYTAFATVVATVFMVLPYLVAPSRIDLDKASAYECGFDAFGEARSTFSVSFYLVSIMYLLFDIEIVYLFPYVMTHASTPMYWTMNLFLSILVAGFVYEWGVGALEWRESQAH